MATSKNSVQAAQKPQRDGDARARVRENVIGNFDRTRTREHEHGLVRPIERILHKSQDNRHMRLFSSLLFGEFAGKQ